MRKRFELFFLLSTVVFLALLSTPATGKYRFSEEEFFFTETPRGFENISCAYAKKKDLGELKILWHTCFPRGSTEEERRHKYFDTLKITITNKQKGDWKKKVLFSRFGCHGCFSHWESNASIVKLDGKKSVLLLAESIPGGSSGGSIHHIALFDLAESPQNIGELVFPGYETYWDPEFSNLILPEYLKDADKDGIMDILTNEYNCINHWECRNGGWIYSLKGGKLKPVKRWSN